MFITVIIVAYFTTTSKESVWNSMHAVSSNFAKMLVCKHECDGTNSLYPVTMTTIRHCPILEFGRGIQWSRAGHHQTSARHWRYGCPKQSFVSTTSVWKMYNKAVIPTFV